MRAVRSSYSMLVVSVLLAMSPAAVLADEAAVTTLQTASHLRLHNVKEDDMAVYLAGDKMEVNEEGELVITGDAQVRRIDSVSKGDQIRYKEETGDVKVRGNGLLMRDGSIVRSPTIDYNLNDETGEMSEPEFWMNSGGAGTAEHGTALSRQHLRLKTVNYSACPCPAPSWFIKAPTLDLHFDENEGIARHGVLYFKNVPILYSPYFSFPIREERKSGFLTPIYGYSSNSGFEFGLPYYFNLAPNYDATLTPRYYSKRGTQLEGEFRYLGRGYGGQLNGTYLGNDKQADDKRWLFAAEHNHRLGGGFSAWYNYNRVSDDNYFRDFSTFDFNNSTVTELASTGGIRWSGAKYFSSSLSVRQYQTLQDATTNYRRPEYNRMPEFRVRGARYNWNGFDLVSENTATRFEMPFYTGTLSEFDAQRRRRLAPDGNRYSSYTTLSYPMVRAGGYITPQVGLHLSQYNTEWDHMPVGHAHRNRVRTESRVVPLYSIDSGLTFERDASLFGNAAIQTLEPRLYYLYVPYRDQSTLPVFDTSVASFNFAQAFSENIYSGGWDRIANANQLTFGLTSRWLDADTGFERLMLQAAQRLYFDEQKVFLGDRPSNEYPEARRRSDFLLGAHAALTDTLNVRLDAQINPHTRDRNRMSAGFRWQPKRLATLSASYRYERDPRAFDNPDYFRGNRDADNSKERISVTTQWPLTQRLYGLGRVDYSLQEKRSTQTILGLEYKGDCCWTGRFVVQRYAVSAKESNSAVFFQLELSGLGSLGTDPMNLLRERIVGYESVTPPIPDNTIFERYE